MYSLCTLYVFSALYYGGIFIIFQLCCVARCYKTCLKPPEEKPRRQKETFND